MDLPGLQKGAVSEPLKRVVSKAAQEMGTSEQTIFLILSHLCEGIACEVAMDRVVSIPGFGAFGPESWTPRSGISPTHAVPRFSASTQFRNEVRMSCPPFPKAEKQFKDHRRNHSRKNTETETQTTFSAQGRARKDIEIQAAERGVNPYDFGS